MIDLPPPLHTVLQSIRSIGRPRLVGGCVRDALNGEDPDDIDIEVGQTTFDVLAQTLAPFGATDVVGRSFGTIKLRLKGESYDFSLPRRESKIGAGHRRFKIDPEPNLDDASAAARRDFTINAMAWDPFTEKLIDPFGGQSDLKAGILRHTSPAFVEDPLRVLRAMQFAGRFNMILAPATAALARSIKNHFAELAKERVWVEWDKWATRSARPSRGLVVLQESGWLEHFPEIAALHGVPQEPEWHPEGDVLQHTKHCLDELVLDKNWPELPTERRQVAMFAVLAHDFGKPSTTVRVEKKRQLRWTSPRHAFEGIAPTQSFLHRIAAPNKLEPQITPLVLHHLAHFNGSGDELSDNQVRRLARKLAPATIEDLVRVMRADSRGRPPKKDPETLAQIEKLAGRAEALEVEASAPAPYLRGKDLVERGLPPGPNFSNILGLAFEAQLTGTFNSHTEALDWLDSYLKNSPC